MLEVTDELPGTPELIAWFGYWPSFHERRKFRLVNVRNITGSPFRSN